ncbi:hypothetical protein COCCADRAFT_112739, partial [Bipolaris zeicola 26-R-13]
LHHARINPPKSTRDNSATITDIEKVIIAIDSQGLKGPLSHRAVTKNLSVAPLTLTRRHHQQTHSRAAAAAEQRQLISPQYKVELVRYIQRLLELALLPTRAIIKNIILLLQNRSLLMAR